MADVAERLDRIEQAVSATNEQLGEVKGELGDVKGGLGKLEARLDKHDERFDSLESEAQKLRVLEEANSDRINLIAEVQSQHGGKLDEIVKTLVPLKDFVLRVVDDHEHRITALEKGGGASRGA